MLKFNLIQDDILVSNPIKREGINAYFIYTIKWKEKDLTVARRYNEFFFLRNKLIERWPGIYIPSIPGKKAVGNMEMKFVKNRMKLLNIFMNKIWENNYLKESEEIRLFFKNQTDLEKDYKSLPLQTFEEIYLKYSKIFKMSGYFNLVEASKKINDFEIFLHKASAHIRVFKETVTTLMLKKMQELESYVCLMNIFSDFEKYSLFEYSEQDESKLVFFDPANKDLCLKICKLREELKNPYTEMSEWLENEELEIQAILETLNSLKSLKDTKEKANLKKESIEKEIESIELNQKTILSYLKFSNKENDLLTLGSKKKLIEDQLIYLDSIIKISSANLMNTISKFKKGILAGYYRSLKTLTELQKLNSKSITDVWEIVNKNEKVERYSLNNHK